MKKLFLASMVAASTLFADTYVIQNRPTDDAVYVATIINNTAKTLAEQLTINKDYSNIKTPIGIASFVCLDNYNNAERFGNILSENLVHEMQVQGYRVIDFKTKDSIRVDANGDFVLSRNAKELSSVATINFVITGTITRYKGGVMINARMIQLGTNVVMSTAQAFVDRDVYADVNCPEGNQIVHVVPTIQPRITRITK
jgi:TolB-like protein